MIEDCRGVTISGIEQPSAAGVDRVVRALLGHRAETGPLLEGLLGQAPDAPLGWIILGFAQMVLARQELRPRAEQARERARSLLAAAPGTARENTLFAALDDWIAGEMGAAERRLAQHLAAEPLDALAIKLHQSVAFMLGRPQAMRETLERVLPAWSSDQPDAGYIYGCYSFALEETGELERAERYGRKAVSLAPLDAWGAHAVLHCFEMTGRARDGLAWLSAQETAMAGCNNFAYHMHWHGALYHLALDEPMAALTLYDRAVRTQGSDDFRDVANAVSLLWRLEAERIHVGERWTELATLAEARGPDCSLSFAAAHRAMALAAAGRIDTLARQIEAYRRFADAGTGTQARVMAEIGLPLLRAILAAAEGRPGLAVDLVMPRRDQLIRLGGSHAQRDLFIWFLVESALAAGRNGEARRLMAERAEQHVPIDWPRRRLAAAA